MKRIAIILVGLLSFSASAETTTALTLQRLNYKPEKKLIYDLNYDAASCEINLLNPFDVYYRDNQTGERLPEFSKDSEKYFGLQKNSSVWTPTSVAFEFKALDEIKKATGTDVTIIVNMSIVDGACTATTVYSDGVVSYNISNINIQSKIKFGLPLGVDWVSLQSPEAEICVLGDCE
jgi:hypothetical protein